MIILFKRGPNQSEVLLILLYSALLYPTRVFLNRGNHEDISLNMNKHFEPNFKKDTEVKFNAYSLAVFNQCQRLFRRLPLGTIVENMVGYRVFVAHGGISSRLDLQYISSKQLDRFSFPSITLRGNDTPERKKMAEQLVDLLWSDPITSQSKVPIKTGCHLNTSRGAGWLFGSDVTETFCNKYGFDLLIRSHEVRPNGISHDQKQCYTIFSSSYYCYGSNSAAVIIINANERGIQHHR
jgi:diadenosine tetraphosphatase ApaH/serine/threonine PP2A family protein phosphatase